MQRYYNYFCPFHKTIFIFLQFKFLLLSDVSLSICLCGCVFLFMCIVLCVFGTELLPCLGLINLPGLENNLVQETINYAK